MKLSPYILVRIGGLPYKSIVDLSWSNKRSLEEYLESITALEKLRANLLEDLVSLIRIIDDYPAKFYLKIISRDIFNRRNFKLKPFKYSGSQELAFVEIINRLKKYKQTLSSSKKSREDFIQLYQEELDNKRKHLHHQNLPDPLAKGLQLASHSLLKRLTSYLAHDSSKLNKKLLQTERKLLQYLSRVSTKTSPFSSFTKLAVIDLDNKITQSSIRKVRLNNTLFRIFRDTLIHYPPFYRKLNLRINSSLKKEKEEWVFLLNTKNIESIQKIDQSDLIDFIIEALTSDEFPNSFEGFIDFLLKEIEADFESMSNYILELINYGIIEWDWHFSGLDPQWHLKLAKTLDSFSDDPLLQELKTVIEQVTTQISIFESGDLENRKAAQQISFDLLKNISQKLLQNTGLEKLEQSATSDHLQKIFATDFKIPLEQIFYEDVSQVFEYDFEKETFEKISRDLERLSQLLMPITFNSQKEKLLSFYKHTFPDKESVDLLTFYEAYYQNPEVDIQISQKRIIEKRTFFIKALSENGGWINKDHFHIEWKDFVAVEKSDYQPEPSKATLIQLYKIEGQVKAFSDSVFMGYGKMFGRFLNLFPHEVEKEIRINNTKLSKDKMWMELTDASIYNPNVHPALVPLEIQMPGSQNNLSETQQIPISELKIEFDNNQDRLVLRHIKNGKEIKTFNFGFEALENRSPMYRLLSSFSFQSASPDLCSILLNKLLHKVDGYGIIHKPRISVGDHLVIQRKSWAIPKSLIPVKEGAKEESAYFIEINEWRKKMEIPARVFISINPLEYRKENAKVKGDDYKPQYIDFESPLLVQLFSKLIKRISSFMKIEEMLPEPGESDYVQEFLLEWESDSENSKLANDQ